MIKPTFVEPAEKVTVVGRVFSTPLVVKGKTWLPLAEMIALPVMAWVARKRCPKRTWLECFKVAALTMPVVLGSEWGHNLAHAAAARMVSKPMDALRITWGMPLVVYYDINDASVTPRQHMLRAIGGPVFNACLLSGAALLKRCTHPESTAHEVTDAAIGMNTLLLTAGLLPIPGLDGGSILKWALVEGGQNLQQADETVRKVNGVVSAGLAAGAAAAVKKKHLILGGFLGMLAGTALAIALGWLKEQK